MKISCLKQKLTMIGIFVSLVTFYAFGEKTKYESSDLIKFSNKYQNHENFEENQSIKFLVNTYASKGLCKVTTSPGRGNNPYSLLFDGSVTFPWVSEKVNPVFIQLAFNDYIELDKIRILPGEPGYPEINKNDWWVEVANSVEDLNSKTNSYQLLIPKRNDIAGFWDEVTFATTITTKIIKIYVERTTYDNYVHIPEIEIWGIPPTIDVSPGDKFLVIVSSSLYNTGIITDALNDYINDIQKEGWEATLIKVNSSIDTNADYFTPSEKELKALIKSFYDQGFDGFVLIGSDPDIPTAFWKHHKNMSEYGYTNDPCDLFYADMDVWTDLDNNGVYETYDSKRDVNTGKWVPDYTKPANPDNPHFYPEMFYGRISAGPLVNNITEEAEKIKFYLKKVHQYRLNGSMLSEESQKSAMTFAADEYYGMTSPAYTQSVNHIYKNHGIMLCSPATLKKELEKGYKFASIISHSGNDAHAIYKWEDGKRTFAGFNLYDWDNTDARIHYVNFFACYAAKFTVPNFGAHLIFNNDYALNVTGSSGGWGIVLDEECGIDINMNLPIGIMIKNYILRSTNEEGWPKGILHGDPLLTYSNNVTNRPPVITSEMQYLEAYVEETFTYDISVTDPDGDMVTITSDNLPENAYVDGKKLLFTPSLDQVDKTFVVNLIAKDPFDNTYNADVTIYVNSFRNGLLVSDTTYRGWAVEGSVINTYYQVPPLHHRAVNLKTNSNFASITQKVIVSQNNAYKLVYWINKNELLQNSQNMYWRIDELNQNYSVIENINTSIYYDPYFYGEINFNSGSNKKLTFSFHSGDPTKQTSGSVYLTGMRLVNSGICDPLPNGINGEFTAGCDHLPHHWTQESFHPNDALFTWEENGGIDNSKCISIDHDDIPNDSRWQQSITGLIPGAEYILKGWVKGENIQSTDASFTGANLNINLNNTWNHTPGLSGTFDWKEISLPFKAPSTGNITIQCRLGHFGSTVTGKAWFDNISLTSLGSPLIVNAKGSAAGGVFAHFKVLVDGLQIGDAFTSSIYQSYTFPLPIDPAMLRQVEIVFDNDAVINGKDRNLNVQSIVVGEYVIPISNDNVTYSRSDGKTINFYGTMCWNGKLLLEMSGPKISVNAKGTMAGGIYSHFKVLIDDLQIGETYTSTDYQPYAFHLPKAPATIRKIEIIFDNDAVIDGKDRNLDLESIMIGENIILLTNENVTYIRSDGEIINFYGTMWWNGKLLFEITKPQISVNAKGTAAGGIYPHFKILVDGSQIGETFTSSTYQPYIFPLSIDPATVQHVQIVFDNDEVINGKDRNLNVQSIALGENVIPLTKENVTYIISNGKIINFYGTMWWNGFLTFDHNITNGRTSIVEARNSLPRQEFKFNVDVFPNPNHGKFHLKFEATYNHPINIILYDSSGKLQLEEILTNVYQGDIKEFTVPFANKGTYFITVFNDEISLTKKVLVR